MGDWLGCAAGAFNERVGPRHVKARWCAGALLIGATVAVWAWLVLPVEVPENCPPKGEGWHMCALQRAWAPAVTQLALALTAVWLLAGRRLVVTGRTAGVAGASVSGRAPRPRRAGRPPDDPLLHAASWGDPRPNDRSKKPGSRRRP